MAIRSCSMFLILVIGLMLCKGGYAQTQSNCTSTLMTLSSCLNYVRGNSSTPSQQCCSSLAGVVRLQPRCLCSLLNTGAGFTLGLAINQTLALALPSACNVQTPPVSQCNAVNNGSAAAPAPTPVGSPSNATMEQPQAPSTTSFVPSTPSGSKAVPSTPTSDGSRMTSTFATLFIALSTFTAFNLLGH